MPERAKNTKLHIKAFGRRFIVVHVEIKSSKKRRAGEILQTGTERKTKERAERTTIEMWGCHCQEESVIYS